MVLFAISSKLIFTHFIYHTLLFIIPSSFNSYFNSITLIITHLCFSFLFASMFSIHSFPSITIPFFLSTTSITLTLIHYHSNTSIPFHFIIPILIPLLIPHSHMFSGILVLHYQVFVLFSLIPTLFIDSYHLSFLLHAADLIHLISSLLILITSLYLLSLSINLDSILCSMYYDLSISFPSYFNSITLITTHPCYSFLFAFLFFMHPFPSLSSSQPLQSHSLLSISIPILSFHSISSFPFICYFSFDSSLSLVQWYHRPSLSSLHSVFTHSYAFHRFLSFFISIPFY